MIYIIISFIFNHYSSTNYLYQLLGPSTTTYVTPSSTGSNASQSKWLLFFTTSYVGGDPTNASFYERQNRYKYIKITPYSTSAYTSTIGSSSNPTWEVNIKAPYLAGGNTWPDTSNVLTLAPGDFKEIRLARSSWGDSRPGANNEDYAYSHNEDHPDGYSSVSSGTTFYIRGV